MGVPFRFMHAADLHLDSPFKGLSDAPPHVRDALMDSTFSALKRLTDTAIAEGVDFVVFAGDLFDSAERSLRAQAALHRAWSSLGKEGIGAFVIHGNHDPLNGERAGMALPDGVHVFGTSEAVSRPAFRRDGELAASVTGISYGSRSVTDNLARGYKPDKHAPYRIALLHGNVDGNPSHDPYAPCALADLTGAGFDYWALGHIHDRRVLHEYPHVVYAGNVQGRHVRETGAKGCYIVDVSADKQTRPSFRELDAVRWLNAGVPIEGAGDEEALLIRLEDACEAAAQQAAGRPVMLTIELTGHGVLHRRLSEPAVCADLLLALRERLEAADGGRAMSDAPWVWVNRLDTRTKAEVDLTALAEADSFAGELLRAAKRLETDPAELSRFAAEAMAPLAEHARLRRLLRGRGQSDSGELLARASERLALMLADEEDAP